MTFSSVAQKAIEPTDDPIEDAKTDTDGVLDSGDKVTGGPNSRTESGDGGMSVSDVESAARKSLGTKTLSKAVQEVIDLTSKLA